MAQADTPGWLAYIAPTGVIMGALWAGARRLLISVTRDELAQILKDLEDARELRRQELHRENLRNFSNLFERMEDVEKGLSRVEGHLSGRFQRIQR